MQKFKKLIIPRCKFLSLEKYGVGIIKDIMVPCRDGVRLAMDVYRPTKNGELVDQKFPTILERTPYNKESNEMYIKADYFVKRGYNFAVQDCRGRFKSEGQFYLAINDPNDGFDAVEWIAKQSWSNGKIGTMGTSYGGWVQSGLALLNPPHLTDQGTNPLSTFRYLYSQGILNSYHIAKTNVGGVYHNHSLYGDYPLEEGPFL